MDYVFKLEITTQHTHKGQHLEQKMVLPDKQFETISDVGHFLVDHGEMLLEWNPISEIRIFYDTK